MKTITSILALTALIALLYSCKDIANNNFTNDNTKQDHSLSKDDSLSFLELPIIDFDSVHIHRIPYLNVTFKNISDNYTIKIYNINIKNYYGFKLYPEFGFPVIIPPKQSNSDNRFVAEWDTYAVTVGTYIDTVYLNNSQKYTVLIKGIVYDK